MPASHNDVLQVAAESGGRGPDAPSNHLSSVNEHFEVLSGASGEINVMSLDVESDRPGAALGLQGLDDGEFVGRTVVG